MNVASSHLCTHIAYMGKKEDAVRRALELYRGSVRGLAQEAGLSEPLVRFVRDGTRSATPATVQALSEALERLSERNAEAARILRDSLSEEGGAG